MLLVLATMLGACARRSETPVSSLGEDDDAFCRAKGFTIGSNDYVACRKDRDVQRGNATARADKAQRNLGELMLGNPEAGPRR
jgi:PleD family two-component response regulator